MTQNVFHAIVGAVAPGQLNGGYTRATFPVERIMTEGRILDARSVRFEDGGVDTIFGNGGDDFLFGGKQGDTIDGANGENVVFGDHGAITRLHHVRRRRSTISGSVVTRSDTGSFAAEGFSAGMRIQTSATLGSLHDRAERHLGGRPEPDARRRRPRPARSPSRSASSTGRSSTARRTGTTTTRSPR